MSVTELGLLGTSVAIEYECFGIGIWHQVFRKWVQVRGGGQGSSTIFKKFNEPYAPS